MVKDSMAKGSMVKDGEVRRDELADLGTARPEVSES
jgi:hypothetical protein